MSLWCLPQRLKMRPIPKPWWESDTPPELGAWDNDSAQRLKVAPTSAKSPYGD